MTPKYCECGCGNVTPIAKQTKTKLGHVKGQHVRFLVGHGGRRGKDAVPISERFWPLVDKRGDDECWLWTGPMTTRGYGRISQRKKLHLAHRVAYELSKGPIPDGLVVRHTCDNPPCCNPNHLLTGTAKDNSQDAIERDRVAHGRRIKAAKLTERDVREVRTKRDNGHTISALAREYGVSRSTIRQAIRGATWARVA